MCEIGVAVLGKGLNIWRQWGILGRRYSCGNGISTTKPLWPYDEGKDEHTICGVSLLRLHSVPNLCNFYSVKLVN